MKTTKIAILSLVMFILMGCSSVPITGRRQVLLVSDQQVLSSSLTQYNSYIKTATKSNDKKDTETVRRVGKRIADATEIYLRQNGLQLHKTVHYGWAMPVAKESKS